jgi:hypothetical protein
VILASAFRDTHARDSILKLQTARSLGVEVPPALLARAGDVIELPIAGVGDWPT